MQIDPLRRPCFGRRSFPSEGLVRPLGLLLALAAFTTGCGDDDATPTDAGVTTDATVTTDAGLPDGGATPIDAAMFPGARVFVSSQVLSGDSIADASATCRRLADDAGLGGSWFAWTSGPGLNAKDVHFGQGPWYRMDGEMVFADKASIADGPMVPISIDELGNSYEGFVFTGTNATGLSSGENCRGWRSYYDEDSGTVGNSAQTGSAWTSAEVIPCGTARRVYCFEDTQDPHNDALTFVSQWNELMLAAVRRTASRPTVTTRRLFMVSTAMYDAWAAYDADATPYALGAEARRPADEQTDTNRREAISYAAYLTLLELFEGYEEATGHFAEHLQALGYPLPTEGTTETRAAEIGRRASEAIITNRTGDGSNEERNFGDMTSAYFPERYTPQNSPDPNAPNTVGGAAFDPNRWTPIRVPTGIHADEDGIPAVDHDDDRTYIDQVFITPHWGAVVPFALTAPDQFRPPAPPQFGSDEPYTDALGNASTGDEAWHSQFNAVLATSAALTDDQKVRAEFWADGPRTESPPGHWNQIAHGVSSRDEHSIAEDIQMYFALNAALLDAGISTWEAKRAYDFIRPVSAIHFLHGGTQVMAWAGPGMGTQSIDGSEWRPYQNVTFVTPAFAEFVSGHSTFSRAAAEVLTRIAGDGAFYDGTTRTAEDIDGDGELDLMGQHIQRALTNVFEPSPAEDVVLRWNTFIDAADDAGLSRIYGGIHIQDGDLRGRTMGQAIGVQAYERATEYWTGTD